VADQLDAARRAAGVCSPVLVLRLTFEENCPDVRNTRVIDAVRALQL
jgi:UDP-N-acetyl-D-galactosamine dehydrogenase